MQLKYKILSWVIFILMLAVITTCFYFVKVEQSHVIEDLTHKKDEKSKRNTLALVYGSIVFIIIFNKFILFELTLKV